MRFSLVTRLLLMAATVMLASCGHKSSTPPDTTPASITVTPSSFSMTHGEVAALSSASTCVSSSSVSCVQVLNASNTAVTATVTYTSADPTAVTVTSTGLVCAGVFDANNVVCQTRDSSGNALRDAVVNINVSAGTVKTTLPVYIHGHVDNVTVSGPSNPPVCVSQNQTEQFTAAAFSAGQDITPKVGPFSWATGNSTVATADSNGVVTSRMPGATTVVASVGAVAVTAGTPGVFVSCPPARISLHLSGATDTSFKVASGTTETLAADVTDILGQPISNAGISFSSFVPTAAAAASSGGSVTTPGAGVTTIIASCTPPGCNPASGPNVNFNGTGAGLAIYSNPIVGTVTGTTATTIYVTGSDNPDGSANKSLIPIDSGTNAAGTAVTLGGSPNSMVFSPDGSKAYIGSDAGLLIFDPATNAVTATASGLTGKVLTVSNNGNKVVLSDTSAGKVFVFDTTAQNSQEFDIANVTAADFAVDNSKAYFTSGTAVYEYSPNTGLKTLSFQADGVVFAPQASVAFFGGTSILGLAICNDSSVPGAAVAVNVLGATPDGRHMISAGSSGWLDLSYTISALANAGCPVNESNSTKTAGFPAFVGTPTKIAIASDDSNAFLTGYSGGSAATGVPFYHLADGSTGAITLSASGPLFSGGVTQDAHSLYVGVGGSSPAVHRIDLTASGGPADANSISVSFNPRIVVVRPK